MFHIETVNPAKVEPTDLAQALVIVRTSPKQLNAGVQEINNPLALIDTISTELACSHHTARCLLLRANALHNTLCRADADLRQLVQQRPRATYIIASILPITREHGIQGLQRDYFADHVFKRTIAGE